METISLARTGHVVTATIDHPNSSMNAVDAQLHRDFGELFRMLKMADGELLDGARAIVLTGSGRAFSAGGDMAWFPELRSPDRLARLRREGKQIIWDQLDVEIPIVCGLNGPAVGLGASIALMCDVIVMAETAAIIDPHVQVGLVAGDGGAAIWPLLLGPMAAKRHLMLGDPLTATEALRLGVAAEICPAADVGAAALRWAGRIAAQAPLAVQGTKIAVNQQLKASVAHQLRCVDGLGDCRASTLLTTPRQLQPSSTSAPPTSKASEITVRLQMPLSHFGQTKV